MKKKCAQPARGYAVVTGRQQIMTSTISSSRQAAIKSWLGEGAEPAWRPLWQRKYGCRTAKVEIREVE